MFRFFNEKEKKVTAEIFKDFREDNSVSTISSRNTSLLGNILLGIRFKIYRL